jgi:hypothetical protein
VPARDWIGAFGAEAVRQANPPEHLPESRGVLRDGTGVTSGREKPLADLTVPVPQTNTGRRAEDAKARERTLAKELGNLAP